MSQAGCCNMGGSGADDDFLTGNVGGPVGQDGAQNTNIIGAGGVTVTGNPGTHTLTITSVNTGGTIVTIFNVSGMWTKNAATKFVEIIIMGAGGGGGSGISSNTFDDANNVGGGGGGNDGSVFFRSPAIYWGATETVTIGAGGVGGASVTGSGVGNDGGAAGMTSIGNLASWATKYNTFFSVGQTSITFGLSGNIINSQANGSAVNFGINNIGSPYNQVSNGFGGGSGNFTGQLTNKNGADFPPLSPPPFGGALGCPMAGGFGGGGGAIGTGGVADVGGRGGNLFSMLDWTTVILAGGSAGAINGNGGNGVANTTIVSGGLWGCSSGGGGGGSSVAGAGGTGGNGGTPGGSGGGGGNSSAAQPSGKGGNGGHGQVIVVEYT